MAEEKSLKDELDIKALLLFKNKFAESYNK